MESVRCWKYFNRQQLQISATGGDLPAKPPLHSCVSPAAAETQHSHCLSSWCWQQPKLQPSPTQPPERGQPCRTLPHTPCATKMCHLSPNLGDVWRGWVIPVTKERCWNRTGSCTPRNWLCLTPAKGMAVGCRRQAPWWASNCTEAGQGPGLH